MFNTNLLSPCSDSDHIILRYLDYIDKYKLLQVNKHYFCFVSGFMNFNQWNRMISLHKIITNNTFAGILNAAKENTLCVTEAIYNCFCFPKCAKIYQNALYMFSNLKMNADSFENIRNIVCLLQNNKKFMDSVVKRILSLCEHKRKFINVSELNEAVFLEVFLLSFDRNHLNYLYMYGDFLKFTCLRTACFIGSVAEVERLILCERTKATYVDWLAAINGGNVDVVKCLYRHYGSPPLVLKSFGYNSLLLHAIETKFFSNCIEIEFKLQICEIFKNQINLPNRLGETPLMKAIVFEDLVLANYLIDNDANLYAKDHKERDILQYAVNCSSKLIYTKIINAIE